jgi:hypothetical protein
MQTTVIVRKIALSVNCRFMSAPARGATASR